MDNKGNYMSGARREGMSTDISMFDTMLASSPIECHDEPTQDLSLALHN